MKVHFSWRCLYRIQNRQTHTHTYSRTLQWAYIDASNWICHFWTRFLSTKPKECRTINTAERNKNRIMDKMQCRYLSSYSLCYLHDLGKYLQQSILFRNEGVGKQRSTVCWLESADTQTHVKAKLIFIFIFIVLSYFYYQLHVMSMNHQITDQIGLRTLFFFSSFFLSDSQIKCIVLNHIQTYMQSQCQRFSVIFLLYTHLYYDYFYYWSWMVMGCSMCPFSILVHPP